MKSSKQIASELNISDSALRQRVYRLGLKYMIKDKKMFIDYLDEQKLINYDQEQSTRIQLWLRHKKEILNEFLCMHVISTQEIKNATELAAKTDVNFNTAKRVFNNKFVIAQSKINFGIV